MEDLRKKQKICVAIFSFMLLYLVIQFHYVMVYFDDYGYYSLSYGVNDFHIGNSYSFSELIDYLKIHYFDVNGRLPGYLVWLGLYMIGGLTLVQMTAAIIVLSILIVIWLFVNDRNDQIVSAILICAFYGLISQEMHRQGTYWFAAFFQYVAPVAAIVCFVIYYFKYREQKFSLKNQIILSLLTVISAYSQEQLSVTVTFMMCLLLIFELIHRNFKLFHIVLIFIAGTCVALLLLSPSSLNRATASGNPMLLTIVYSTYNTIRTFFSEDNRIFIILLNTALFVFSFELWKKENGILKLIDLAAMLYSVFSIILYVCTPLIELLAAFTLNRYYALITLGVPCVALIALQIIRYYWMNHKLERLLLFMTAVGSVGCLCFVPETPSRLFISSWLMLFPLLYDGFCGISKLMYAKVNVSFKSMSHVLCLIIVFFSVINAGEILYGYYNNYQAYRYNDAQLSEYASTYTEDSANHIIHLKTMPAPEYAAALAYHHETTFMIPWIKNYYGITDNPLFYFSDLADKAIPDTAYVNQGNHVYYCEKRSTS